MKELGYYNGRIGELNSMTVPMNDRASWFGDGVYDAELSRNYRIFALDEHVDRFYRSADLLEIRVPMGKQDLKDLLNELVRKMDTGDLFVYYQVTRGGGNRNHVFPEGPANLWVTLTPKEVNTSTAPIGLITAEDTRFFHCNIKTLNLIPAVMYSEKAKRAGCQECVLYRPGGRVTECAHSNIHMLKNGEFRTPPADNLILAGIARARLIRACRRLGVPVREEPFTLTELLEADEVLNSSSSNLCLRAGTIDGKPVGLRDEALFMKIRNAIYDEFFAETEAEA